MTKKLTEFLEHYITKKSLFTNKKSLQSNYTPKTAPYRGEQINQLAGILAPSLRMEKPSNVFIYGKTGSGKTLVARYVSQGIMKVAQKNSKHVVIIYLNCKLKRVADTEYRLIAQVARELGEDIPPTGLPTDEVYKIFVRLLNKKQQVLIIILDEIDQLVHKIGDDILYNLTRLSSELHGSEISFIGISNDLMFIDNVDPRVKSSLSEEEMVFPAYNAVQLEKILRQRVGLAFHDGVVGEGVVEKCAAYAAREHGDARRALELMRVAGEIAERKNQEKVIVEDIDFAEEKIEKDRIIDSVSMQPKQFKLTLYSILTVCKGLERGVFTGDVYEVYRKYCTSCGITPLTQRRLGDIIAELDMLGVINAKVISKGRYGRTREISLTLPVPTIATITTLLQEGLGL